MKFFIILIIFSTLANAEENTEALWEIGIGIGHAHYEQYPASDEYSDLVLPFPTFQYRGEVLRADDREGTRAYILKNRIWSLEFSGGGVFALDASDNKSRAGMPDLPWMLHLGPQVVGQFTENIELRVGIFQAISTDFAHTKSNGGIVDSKLLYQWDNHVLNSVGHAFIALMSKFASKDYLETYFQVDGAYVTPERSLYEAREGYISTELQIFQSLKYERTTLYLGASITDYSGSANRESPLHKSNQNVSSVIGITYALEKSEKASIPTDDTKGIINKQRGSKLK